MRHKHESKKSFNPPLQSDRAQGPASPAVPPLATPLNENERALIAALREIAYGEVAVVVHNARIVQITRSQKFRFAER